MVDIPQQFLTMMLSTFILYYLLSEPH